MTRIVAGHIAILAVGFLAARLSMSFEFAAFPALIMLVMYFGIGLWASLGARQRTGVSLLTGLGIVTTFHIAIWAIGASKGTEGFGELAAFYLAIFGIMLVLFGFAIGDI